MDDESPSPRPKWVPVTLFATGTVLIAAPLFYLWRVGKPNRISLRAAGAVPPPPRRAGALSSASASSPFTFQTPITAKENAPPSAPDWDDDADWGVPAAPLDPNDKFNGVLYSFKAFGSATLIMLSLTFGGVWGLCRYLDVDNAEDFGVEMRKAVMDRMPLLALRMRDSLVGPAAESTLDKDKDRPPAAWTGEGAEERLADAFEKGGLGAWAAAVAQEMQEEARAEMEKRVKLRKSN